MNVVGFPTQGEVLQFVFNALGVLPRKHERDESFEEVRKKATQAALRRLASEDGQLEPNLANLLKTLSYLTAGALPPRAFFAFGEAFFDLFETYRHALNTEGTYLGKVESVKYLLLEYCAPRLAISIAKQLQRLNVAADGLLVPREKFWYLPMHDGQNWKWPLERVMLWAYEITETSAAQFHCPDQDPNSSLLSKNLDSARNWLRGENLPSWTSLLQNFRDSFEAVNRLRARQGRSALSSQFVRSVFAALFLARASTAVAMDAVEHYGDEPLLEFCNRFRLVSESTVDATETVRREVGEYIKRKQLPPSSWDEAWFRVTTDYWEWFVHWQDKLRHSAANGGLSKEKLRAASRELGRLSVLELENQEAFASVHVPPEGFGELIMSGIALQASKSLSMAGIESYIKRLEAAELTDALPWITPWLRSTLCYRGQRYTEAYPHAKEAYESAQYCAGAGQRLLLNQYIDLAAKNDKWKDFRKAVLWAEYLGIEVRGLSTPASDRENLRAMFELSKRVHYVT